MPHILSGIRVIDCGTYIAAPAAATILGDFGAEVIKIERPPAGDPYRLLSRLPGMPVSPIDYCWVLDSRNKKSIALDLNDADAREALLKLAASADVFITNYQPHLLRKFRLTFEDLRPLNTRLIYAQVTGYGELGPESEKPAFDTTAYWARSGLMSLLHNAGAEPTRSPAGFGDHPTAVSLFGAIMLGLYQRDRTGAGSKVSTSLMANGAWSNSCQIQAAFCRAEIPPRVTRKSSNNPLVNHYLTRDSERFMLCCLDPAKDWSRLCAATALGELARAPKFSTPEARSANGRELVEIFDREFAREDMAEWKRRFAAHEVIWSPVPTFVEVAEDAQMRSNGVFADIEDAPAAPLRTIANPIVVENAPKVPPRMAPVVGQHSVEILRSLGYTEEAIESMLQRGATISG